MMRSLKARLFAGMTMVILLTGGLGGLLAYRWAYDEAIETQDSVLNQIGAFAQKGNFNSGQTIPGVDAYSDITMLAIPGSSCQGAEACLLAGLPDGLHMATIGGKPVRVLLNSRADGDRFAIAQRTAVRDEIAGDFAIRAILPIAALIPCLMLITAIVIAHSFQPVVKLAQDVNARRPEDLTALPERTAPEELLPFIASINGLLGRMKLVLDRQQRFVADAAHELRTPITALSVQAENLEAIELPEHARHRLLALKEGLQRTRHLLDQLLLLARQNAGSVVHDTTVDLDQVIKDVAADLMPIAAHKNIDLGFGTLPKVSISGQALDVAAMIRNLADNAIRYTPSGGRVDIALVHDTSGKAVVQIDDSGPGIHPADFARLFEPFFRGNQPAGDGTGLGLAIAKRIALRLGGSIELTNIGGDGSGLRATVCLPVRMIRA